MAGQHHPPSILSPLYSKLSGSGLLPEFLKGESGLIYFQVIVISWLIMFGLVLFSLIATRHLKNTPNRLQALIEVIVDKLGNMFDSLMGHGGRKYLGLLGTSFIFIFCLNIMGLIPGLMSPTANWNCTISMALVVIFMVQIYGIKSSGFLGYFKHLAGSPKGLIMWVLVPMMFPLHILGELIKPLSLSIRLYGNISGEDSIILSLVNMGFSSLPLQLMMMFFAVFTSFLQAFVFTALSSIYIMLLTAHE
ncbi:MAG: F0F1 ATP synthase subunit A [Candidatus Brocadiia bacterium]